MKIESKAQLIALAIRDTIEVSIRDLADCLKITSEYPLDVWEKIERFLEEFELVMSPSLKEEIDGDVPRILRSKHEIKLSEASLRSEIEQDESNKIEYKSSIYYDLNRAKNDPNAQEHDLRSNDVTESSLKNIAAFLNSDGGVLYIGVSDDKKILGIEHDFRYVKGCNADGWLLSLTTLVAERFKDGRSILGYVKPEIFSIEGRQICRIEVSRRGKPAFMMLQRSKKFAVFERFGSETREIGIEDFEEFLARRSS